MKAYRHARNSVHKYGGKFDDYIAIHEEMDSSKAAVADLRHRVVFHSAFGIFIVEKIFGRSFVNADGSTVQVRDIAEDHVLEDLGRIPPLSDYLQGMPMHWWLGGPHSKGNGRNGRMTK